MNRLAVVAFALTIVGCGAALWLSVWPGLLLEVVMVGLLIGLLPAAALMFVGLVVGLMALARGWRPALPNRAAIWRLLSVPVIAAITLALLLGRVPCRVAFWISQSSFAAAAGELDVPVDAEDGYTREELGRRLGVYLVDQYGIDARGGIYFRVSTGPDGIGPNRTSYGFVKQPNLEGSPFGAAHYRLEHLTGDWYLFAASDDWF